MKVKSVIFTALVALFFSIASSAQTPLKVNYDSIKEFVENQPEQFKALTARFIDADSTLTLDEVATVYYGHAFTPEYDPNEKYTDILEALTANDLNLSITLIYEAMRKNPVALPLLFKLYGCCAVSDVPRIKNRAESVQSKILMLCDAIFASGKGIIPEEPWLVIDEDDIDEFLKKYCGVVREFERVDLGNEKAIKVQFDGIADEVIVYFDLSLQNKHNDSLK